MPIVQVPNESFCAFGARSYTLPISNLTYIADINLVADFSAIAGLRMPPRYLLDFLHEATHRWCFRMAVGTALAVLGLRARRAVLGGALEGRDARSSDFLDARIRYEAALRYLRPISEGLAMFCELDAQEGDSAISAWPLSAAKMLFAGREMATGNGNQAIDSLLWQTRLEDVGRRKRLLEHRFDCSTGGYLPGYLAVKYLWRIACKKDRRFFDKSLFLTFAMNHFFRDYKMIGALLAPAGSDEAFLKRLDYHYRSRVNDIMSNRVSSSLDAMLDWLGSIATVAPLVVVGPEVDRVGLDLLRSSVESLQQEAWDLESLLGHLDAVTLARREYIWLASERVDVCHEGSDLVARVGPQEMLRTRVERLSEATGSGTLDIYLDPEHTLLVAAVSADEQLVAIVPLMGKVTGAHRERLVRLHATRPNVLREEDMLYRMVAAAVHEAGGTKRLEHSVEQAAAVSNDIHTRIWLMFAANADVEACRAAMRDSGFRGVMGSATAALTLFSLCGSFGASKTVVRKVLKSRGLDYDECFAQVRDLSSARFTKSVVYEGDHEVMLSLV
jgi:hypothetical protein